MLRGIDVILYVRQQTGTDDFNAPIYVDIPQPVNNVLVCPAGAADVINDLQLHGKKAEYELCIPKGDTHDWEDSIIEFFGHKFRSYGFAQEYISDNLPLKWNKKIKVERYG